MPEKPTILSLRLPADVYDQIKKVAPVRGITDEIIKRLRRSFQSPKVQPPKADEIIRPMRSLGTLIDARNQIIYFEIETDDGVFKFSSPADEYARLMKALMRDVPIVEAALAAGNTNEPIIPTKSDRKQEVRARK